MDVQQAPFNIQWEVPTIGNIMIHHECEGEIEISVLMIAGCHHEACQVMTNYDPEGLFFYPTRPQILNYFSCSPLTFYFKISFQKSLNRLHMKLSEVSE